MSSFGSIQAFSNGFAKALGVAAVLSLLGAIAGVIQPGRRNVPPVQAQASEPETRKNEAGVLSQECHQSRDICLLPQGHIAVKEVLNLEAWLRHRGLASLVHLVQSASGTLQGGIDGGNGEIEPFGHFNCWPLQHLAQEQNGSLHWR
jgi:hypothetical protein